MELRDEATAPSTRWVKPFPESHPEVEVELRRVPAEKTFRVYDRLGIKPGQDPKNTWAKWYAAQQQLIIIAVNDWKGFTDHGKDLPCTDDAKPRLLEKMVEANGLDDAAPGSRIPIWRVIQDAFTKAEDAEEKNS